MPLTLMTARAAARMRAMLDRGFTTVRDTGGCDWGIKTASSRAICPVRACSSPASRSAPPAATPTAAGAPTCARAAPAATDEFKSAIADGADEVRKAAREQMRQGADHVKIMVSGGVASPYDPLDSLQFSHGRDAAPRSRRRTAFGRYVCAHAYSAEAITRAASQGVRTIEHGNLIDDAAAKLMEEKGMFLVANLVAYYAMKERAAKFGMTPESLAKNELVIDGGLQVARDLQARTASRSATAATCSASCMGPEPRVHAAARGASRRSRSSARPRPSRAQILRHAKASSARSRPAPMPISCVVDGDPAQEPRAARGQGEHLSVIMKAGRFHKKPAALSVHGEAPRSYSVAAPASIGGRRDGPQRRPAAADRRVRRSARPHRLNGAAALSSPTS